jgi:hypothetical protein
MTNAPGRSSTPENRPVDLRQVIEDACEQERERQEAQANLEARRKRMEDLRKAGHLALLDLILLQGRVAQAPEEDLELLVRSFREWAGLVRGFGATETLHKLDTEDHAAKCSFEVLRRSLEAPDELKGALLMLDERASLTFQQEVSDRLYKHMHTFADWVSDSLAERTDVDSSPHERTEKWPPDDKWHFAPDFKRFAVMGKVYDAKAWRMQPRELQILKVLAEAAPATRSLLQINRELRRRIEQKRFSGLMSELRQKLGKALDSDAQDVLPNAQRGKGWTLLLPVRVGDVPQRSD